MMGIPEFAELTRRVIRKGGIDDFLPTACYPERRKIAALEGAPAEGDMERISVEWAMQNSHPGETVLVAFRSSSAAFKVVCLRGPSREEQVFPID